MNSTSSSKFTNPKNNKLHNLVQKKKQTLNPENSNLKEIFKNIGNNIKNKIDLDDFKEFLELRYPVPVVETILKSFQFQFTSYEDYVQEMAKFINLREDKHLKFCFEIFDFNKDGNICYKDAFKALELRVHNYYDFDFAIIKEMLTLKREGKLSNKMLRRKSTFSLIKERLEKKQKKELGEKNQKQKELKKIEKLLNEQNTMINFKEFCMIKFNGRPQFLRDFFQYTCGYDYLTEKGLSIPVAPRANRSSEIIVMEMNINQDFHESLRKTDKYDYYCSLDTAMSLYTKSELEIMLMKFKYLQSEEKLKYTVITKQSMILKLVTII